MKNIIIDNSLKNSISITDKVNITNKREQNASQSKEQLENSYSNSIGDLSIDGLLAKKVKQEIYSNKRKEARKKLKNKKK